MLTVTLIRHGESTDNVRHVWAGWADAPLSQRGKAQAEALGAYLSQTPFTKIYASPLKRAATTAGLVLAAQPAPQPPYDFTVESIKEQNFGVAEGKSWCFPDHGTPKSLAEYMDEGKYPTPRPGECFTDGESDEDLAARAMQAVDEVIMPHVRGAARAGRVEHIALVSHGIYIGALICALLKRDSRNVVPTHEYTGMQNTAWARVVITIQGVVDGTPIDLADEDTPPLIVTATDFGRADHLVTLKPNAGGTGKIAYDPKQQDIRAFFSGATKADATEHCESNALDEIDREVNN
ncbi:phosphoglycerate mutase-like protein [Suillus clintonianus]|uniref:phosphoglycerate mutase-like protein n=1 Tax=Suillus clintonianus TaxID=1904413 RepID=UPI001B87BE52|nr:phosphoglycerate mutase-like protein [Suillus clintonianus]KAG2135085.1 phosphoglycerate mutase-like protein [Suillus clintonianus]